jgi:hypothetical protein
VDDQRQVQIRLTHDEALVLFDWLHERGDDESLEPLIAHWSEQLVLWNIEGQLDKLLVEPFDPNYADRVNAARERLVADIAPEDRRRVK